MSLALGSLAGFALLAALQVITSANAVHAVFFLVLVFILTSVLRLALSREFRALVFLMVYVGAIAVLFLFVVRRLNITSTNHTDRRPQGNLPRRALLAALFFRPLSFMVSADVFEYNNATAPIDTRSSRVAIGQVLYTTYIVEFLVAGVVLLVARVGAIILTLSSSTTVGVVSSADPRGQHVHEQHSRDSDNAVFTIK